MKYEYIKADVEVPELSYGFLVKTGDIADLPEKFSVKADKSPDWKKAAQNAKVTAERSEPSKEEQLETRDGQIKTLNNEITTLKAENQRLKQQIANLKRGN